MVLPEKSHLYVPYNDDLLLQPVDKVTQLSLDILFSNLKKEGKKNDILHQKSILPSMKVYMFESIIIRDGVKTQLPVDRRLHPVRPVSIILNNDNHLDLLVNRQLGFEVTGCFYE